MQSRRQLGTLFASTLVLIALMGIMSSVLKKDENRDLAGAEFLVS
jgi:hypothetical protein